MLAMKILRNRLIRIVDKAFRGDKGGGAGRISDGEKLWLDLAAGILQVKRKVGV